MKKLLDSYFALVKKFIPDHEPKSLVGLDIGSDTCKMVELKKNGNSYKLVNWAIEPYPGEDKKSVIKKVLNKSNTHSNAPFTSVYGKGTLIRYIDVTKMSLEDLKNSLKFEADKYFPFPQDQIYTDCYIIDNKMDGNKMFVLVAAAKKEVVDGRVQLLTELDLQTDFIGINSIAIANVVNVLGIDEGGAKQGKEEPKALAILDAGEHISSLSIVMDKKPRFTRDIFIGGQSITKSIANALGLSVEEAEKLKCAPKGKLKDVTRASESAVVNLVSELRMSFDYFVTEENTPISQLKLTGGGALMEGLAEAISKNLEIPVDQWNPLELLETADNISKEDVKAAGPKLGVALGLALYH